MDNDSLTIVHVISNLGDGGAEGVLYRLCVFLPQYRHIVVSMTDKGKYGEMLISSGVNVHCLNMKRGKLSFSGIYDLWLLLRHTRPDVVQTWMYHADLVGGVVSRLAGIKNIFWGIRQGSLPSGVTSRLTTALIKFCAYLSLVIPKRIISCSVNGVVAHAAMGYQADKFIHIPNGYDLSCFSQCADIRSEMRNELGVNSSTVLIGMVARFHPQKDHRNLLIALGHLKRAGFDFQCVLIGTGADESNKNILNLVEAENLMDCMSLLGRRSDIPRIMNALDLHVLSSVIEGFPNVIAEAMACATPCVTTDVGDAAYIVGETGWVVPPKAPEALAAAIAEAIEAHANIESWVKRQCAARERIQEHFTIDRMVTSYDAVWRDL